MQLLDQLMRATNLWSAEIVDLWSDPFPFLEPSTENISEKVRSDVLRSMKEHGWPDNHRELRNRVKQSALTHISRLVLEDALRDPRTSDFIKRNGRPILERLNTDQGAVLLLKVVCKIEKDMQIARLLGQSSRWVRDRWCESIVELPGVAAEIKTLDEDSQR